MKQNKITIIVYHYVRPIRDSRTPLLKGLEIEDFKQQLGYLKRYYKFISLQQIIDGWSTQNWPENAVLLTFDDGYKDHYTHVFPILHKNKIPGTFFIVSSVLRDQKVLDVNKIHSILASGISPRKIIQLVEGKISHGLKKDQPFSLSDLRSRFYSPGRYDSAEVAYIKRLLQFALPLALRTQLVDFLFKTTVTTDEKAYSKQLYLNADEIKEMAQSGMEIGCHGDQHQRYSLMNEKAQLDDIKNSLSYLRANDLITEPFTFCYPYGEYNNKTITLLKEMGCGAAVTTKVGWVDTAIASLLELPRFNTNDFPKESAAPACEWTQKTALPQIILGEKKEYS